MGEERSESLQTLSQGTIIVREWLSDGANADTAWLLGDVLIQRMQIADWLDNPVLQVIARGHGQALAKVVSAVRKHTTNGHDLQSKARAELNPKAGDFDTRTEDFLAELVSVVYLAKSKFKNFKFLLASNEAMPDIEATDEKGVPYYVEVKNLREPDSPTTAAFSMWHRRRVEQPERFNFTASINFGRKSMEREGCSTMSNKSGARLSW